MIVYSGIFGFVFLSSIPHQEARFLLPLLLPVIIVPSDRFHKLPMLFWVKLFLNFAILKFHSYTNLYGFIGCLDCI